MSKEQHLKQADTLIGLLLFAISLAIKLPYLGAFLTIDEPRWIHGAGQFLLALRSGNLAETYWHFHPGITITWGEALILWLQSLGSGLPLESFVEFQMEHLAVSVGAMRLSGVVLTSLALPVVYGLGKPLLGRRPALLGAGLLAVDPFWVAHSRIVNGDALAGVLMIAAYLAFALLLVKPQLKLAAMAGLLVGLSLLTKLPSQILVVVIAALAAIGYFSNRDWKFWLRALLVCGLVSAATFVLLWPAMWVAPIETLKRMYIDTFDVGDIGGKDKVEFFMGQVRETQSQFFYLLALPFRLTPVNLLGGLLSVALLVMAKNNPQARRATWLLWLFILATGVLANLSPKKADRYLMSVVLAVDLLAGIGWLWLIGQMGKWANERIANRRKDEGARSGTKEREAGQRTNKIAHYALRATYYATHNTFHVLLIAIQLTFTITHYPYVLTYYNPLLGGYARAAKLVPVGWGEGLEQAAAWINHQPDAAMATVSPYYENVTNHYLTGRSLDWSKDGKKQLQADYVVFYVAQTQRKLPYPGLVAYFQAKTAAHIIEFGDTPYIWIYKREQPLRQLAGEAQIIGRAQIVGYDATSPAFRPGAATGLTLYLLTQEQQLPANEDFRVSLVDDAGRPYGNWQSSPGNRWIPNSVVEWRGQLWLPQDLPPGDYQLKVWLADASINAQVAFFDFEEEMIRVEP